jgi:hypothetical protein
MSQYPGAGHDQPSTPNDGAASAGRADKPATLGIIGLALVSINIIVVIVGSLFGPTVYVVTSSSVDSPGVMSDSLWSGLSAVLVLRVMSNLAIGLAGWVIGIVATVTNRGRSFGIAAIVLGAVLLVIAANMMFTALLLKSMG